MSALHHPWHRFRDLYEWRLRWDWLPGNTWGETCHVTRTVTLSLGLNQAERRCTIAHETQHILRGPIAPGRVDFEEMLVDRATARTMLPSVEEVGDALAWSPNLVVAARELWVDEFVLEERLRSLHPSERHYLRRRLREHDAVVGQPGAHC